MTKFTLVPNSIQQLANTKGITLYTPVCNKHGQTISFKVTKPANN